MNESFLQFYATGITENLSLKNFFYEFCEEL